MRTNNDNDWSAHSLMLSVHDLHGLPLRRLSSTVPCSMVVSSVSWRQTWPNHDNLQAIRWWCQTLSWRGQRLCLSIHFGHLKASFSAWLGDLLIRNTTTFNELPTHDLNFFFFLLLPHFREAFIHLSKLSIWGVVSFGNYSMLYYIFYNFYYRYCLFLVEAHDRNAPAFAMSLISCLI